MAKATARAIGRNRDTPIPGIIARGASTRSVQQLATRAGMATSLGPTKEASFGLTPSPRWRCVFSSTMIALSTSGPMARASPASVITLIVLLVQYKPMSAARTATGIVKMAMSVIRHSPRKSKITREQRTAPKTPSTTRLAMEWRT